jgi:hypothetical protein
MTRQAIAVALLLACLALAGCAIPKHTSARTLGAVAADPAGYDGQLVSFWGEARDVAVGDDGMHVLVVRNREYFRVHFAAARPHPSIITGDSVRVLGRVRNTRGLTGLGDRVTGTVQIDAISLAGPKDGYSLSAESELVERWNAGELVVLP